MYFSADSTKAHFLVDAKKLAEKRGIERGSLELHPCRIMSVIALNKDGDVDKHMYFRDPNIINKLFI